MEIHIDNSFHLLSKTLNCMPGKKFDSYIENRNLGRYNKSLMKGINLIYMTGRMSMMNMSHIDFGK
jgi:hypothetical protein